MTAEAAASERAQKIFESFESEEIDGFVGDFKSGFRILLWLPELAAGSGLRRRCNLRGLMRIDEAFLREAIDEFLERDRGPPYCSARRGS